ncbi:MAG: hypothetical protein AAFO94_21130, partial [Bacteroidota bacterium]
MKKTPLLLIVLVSLSLNSCYKRFTEPIEELWKKVDLQTVFPISNIYAGPQELYIASAGDFVRVDANNEIVELRQLNTGERVYGRPMLSDHVFARVVRPPQSQNKQDIEFHLVRSADKIRSFSSDEIATDVSENLTLESSARNTGAFNESGSQYLLPAISAQQTSYSFFLFDIQLNSSKTDFTSVKMTRRINIPELPPDPDGIVNMKYINGFYYVLAIEGAYRIDPSNGSYKRLFNEWYLDAFAYEGNVYITGLSSSNFFRSADNGETWERVPLEMPTQLRHVEVVNNQVITQP